MRRVPATLLLFLLCAPRLAAQSLHDELSQLFIFGEGEDPLFLGGTGDPNNPESVRIHGNHFVPAAVASNGTVISFLTNSIGSSVANVPVSATSGGSTFSFEGGVPVRTSTSAGPVFGERAQTLGRGRVLAGLSRLHCRRRLLAARRPAARERDHRSRPRPRRAAHGDHVPADVRPVRPDRRRSRPPAGVDRDRGHEPGADQPLRSPASRFVRGSSTGVGDVVGRVKINLRRGDPLAVGVLADVRFPTGSEHDLLGSGAFAARGIAILSARFGDFSPHANLGYLYRGGEFETDAVLGTLGFDHLLAPWATLAMDLISQLQVGESPLQVPDPVVIQSPYVRTVTPSIIPDRRDDIVDGSVGLKLTTAPGLTVVANGEWPLNRGGLRPDIIWTVGLEYNF